MYPSSCVISLKRVESTCCHTQYINFVFFSLFLPKHLLVCNSLIHHLHISHNTPCSPPIPPPPPKKESIIIVFNFSWGNHNTQKKLTTMVMQNFGGHKMCIMGVVQINVKFLLVTISIMAATVLWQISSVLFHCICEVVIVRVHCCRLGSRCVELFETWHVSCHYPQALSHHQLQTA